MQLSSSLAVRNTLPSIRSQIPTRAKSPQQSIRRLPTARLFGAYLLLAAALLAATSTHAGPENFSSAKRLLREHVYADQNLSQQGTFYCGCTWRWQGKSGGQIDLSSCGVQTTNHHQRATRLEWEHVMPASMAGQHRPCWRNGGRTNCQKTDPVFNQIEADMHNLVPSIGAINALRSNLPFGMISGDSLALGQCNSKISPNERRIEPRDEVKGAVARIMFYMADRYNIRLGNNERTLIAWDRQYPVSSWELERDRRIAYSMGHSNEFVTGAAQWVQGYRPRGQAHQTQVSPPPRPPVPSTPAASSSHSTELIYANARSRLYHLPAGCPGYHQVAAHNRVPFTSEAEALAAGYRKAGNCR